jgi:hypothetical protein
MYKCLFLATILITFTACDSSSGADNGVTNTGNDSATPPTPVVALDCLNLDPDKVYFVGSFQESQRVLALTDPLNPTDFCIGFPDDYVHQGTVSDLGHFVYAYESSSNKSIYWMNPDELAKNADNLWEYPPFTPDNDTILHTSVLDSCGFSMIKVAPESENVYFSCPNDTINTETVAPYYDLGNTAKNSLLTIVDDGSMLVSDFTNGSAELILVDSALNETILDLPIPEGDTVFGAVKQYVNLATGNQSIWIQVIYHEESVYINNQDITIIRLNLDLATLEVFNEGEFSDLPEGTELGFFVGAFDGFGNLWQQGRSLGDTDDDMIIKRPLAASGDVSEIIYRESNHRNQEVYVGPAQSCDDANFDDIMSGNCNGGVYDWRHYENLFVKVDEFSHFVTGN